MLYLYLHFPEQQKYQQLGKEARRLNKRADKRMVSSDYEMVPNVPLTQARPSFLILSFSPSRILRHSAWLQIYETLNIP